jgi:Protein of unknown function (DUF3828)
VKNVIGIFCAAALLVSCGGEAPVQTATTAPATATAAAPSPAPAASPDVTGAGQVVAELYKNHDAGKSPFFQTENRALVDQYFTKELADMIWKDAVESQGEVGALGFDPLYSAQETEIKNFAVGAPTAEGNGARVNVTFENHGTKEQIGYSLVQSAGAWKIADIHFSDGSTLRGLYQLNAAPAP